jgi:hypothetical protein
MLKLIFENDLIFDLIKDKEIFNNEKMKEKEIEEEKEKKTNFENFFNLPNKINKEIKYFRFKEIFDKSSLILSKPPNQLKDNVLLANFDIENKKIKPVNKLRRLQVVHNPCFLSGYYNKITKMVGLGDYEKCYEQLDNTLGKKITPSEELKNKTSILLGSDFKDIADIIQKENIHMDEFVKKAIEICELPYETAKKNLSSVKNLDNICFKFTYAIVIFDYLFGKRKNILLIFSTNIKNISIQQENEILMSNYFTFNAEKIPAWIIIIFTLLILLFFINYFFKERLILYLKIKFYKNELIILCLEEIRENNKNKNKENLNSTRINYKIKNSFIERNRIAANQTYLREKNNLKDDIDFECKQKILNLVNEYKKNLEDFSSEENIENGFGNYSMNQDISKNQSIFEEEKIELLINLTNNEEKMDILDSTINSLPVKNFLYTVLLKKIKDFCEREIFLSFSEFKIFFYSEVENEIQLKYVILDTIEKRNELKACKIFNLIQIFLSTVLSILTIKIFSYITFNNNYIEGTIIVIFSFLYMILLIFECLVFITLVDYEKYYYSNILTQSERMFLDQEFSVDPNHNNELF